MSAVRPSLRRPVRAGGPLSITPLVDVLLILVVFFLVTSTYRDLDMLPLVETADAMPDGPGDGGEARASVLLLRIGADGRTRLAGTVLDRAAVTAEVAARIAEDATAEVLVLPSPQAPTQALVTVLDAAGAGGALRVRVVRIAEDSEAGAAAGTGGDGSGSGGIGALR